MTGRHLGHQITKGDFGVFLNLAFLLESIGGHLLSGSIVHYIFALTVKFGEGKLPITKAYQLARLANQQQTIRGKVRYGHIEIGPVDRGEFATEPSVENVEMPLAIIGIDKFGIHRNNIADPGLKVIAP